MWIPDRFEMPEDQALDALIDLGAADLITPTPQGLHTTYVPWTFDRDEGPLGTLRAHLARLNPHLEALRAFAGESLVIAHIDDAYISPSWYATAAENPRVVPTWNYTVVHLHGRVRVIDDHEAIMAHLQQMVEHFEAPLGHGWTLDDPPRGYIDGMARAIALVEMTVERVEGKQKQSQNKCPEDVAAIAEGLREAGDARGADAVQEANRGKVWPPLRLKYR